MKKRTIQLFVILFSLLILLNFISAGTLKVTEEHPFLINGEWIPASELEVGDELTLINGSKVVIKNIKDFETEEPFPVYNIEAGEFHNFVVCGEEDCSGDYYGGVENVGVVVHNSNLPKSLSEKQRRILQEKSISPKIQDALKNAKESDFIEVGHVSYVEEGRALIGQTPIEKSGIFLPTDYRGLRGLLEPAASEGVYVMPLENGLPATRSRLGIKFLTGIGKNHRGEVPVFYKMRIPKNLLKVSGKQYRNWNANDFYIDGTKDFGLNFKDLGIEVEFMGRLDLSKQPFYRLSEINPGGAIIGTIRLIPIAITELTVAALVIDKVIPKDKLKKEDNEDAETTP